MSRLKVQMGMALLGAAAAMTVAAPANAYSGTAGLQPGLAEAYDQARQQANADGVTLYITSGRRSWSEQQQLFQQGVAQYGSAASARRWVLPPDESTHVTGEAIDVGPQSGAAWLQTNGTRWGLCRTYANEWWHFELATSPGGTCPAPLPDAADR